MQITFPIIFITKNFVRRLCAEHFEKCEPGEISNVSAATGSQTQDCRETSLGVRFDEERHGTESRISEKADVTDWKGCILGHGYLTVLLRKTLRKMLATERLVCHQLRRERMPSSMIIVVEQGEGGEHHCKEHICLAILLLAAECNSLNIVHHLPKSQPFSNYSLLLYIDSVVQLLQEQLRLL